MQFQLFYNHISFTILVVFILSLLIQLVYHWGLFSRTAFYKRKKRPKLDEELEPVSVVICARNAYEYLTELIPALLSQDYPDFEIVVVNDCSDDETEEYLKEITRQEPRVKPVQMKQHLNFFYGKKFPLSMGIKSAQNDLIILTECSCMPTNDKWLRSVVNCYGNNTEVVIGYSPYVQKKAFSTSLSALMRFSKGYSICPPPWLDIPTWASGRTFPIGRNCFSGIKVSSRITPPLLATTICSSTKWRKSEIPRL